MMHAIRPCLPVRSPTRPARTHDSIPRRQVWYNRAFMCADGSAVAPASNPAGCTAYLGGGSDFKIVSANSATRRDELTPSVTYSVIVRAWNSLGFGWASAPITFTTKPVPQQASASSVSTNSLGLVWPAYLPNGPGQPPAAYNISVSGTDRSGVAFTLLASTSGAVTAYTAVDLVPGQEYEVRVYAYLTVEGWTGGSDVATFRTLSSAPERLAVPVITSPISASGAAWKRDPSSQWIKVDAVQFSWEACGCTHTSTANFDSSVSLPTGWTNSGSPTWTRQSGSTPSSSTGPSRADSGSYYMFLETSSPVPPGATAVLSYTCPSGNTQAVLTFKYNMYGATMGTLRVKSTSGSIIWSKTGNAGTASWGSKSVMVPTAGFKIEGVRGSDFTGDMAVDTLSVCCSGPSGCNNGEPITGYTIKQLAEYAPGIVSEVQFVKYSQ